MERLIVHAADSSAGSQLHPSRSAYRKRGGSSSGYFRLKKSLETEYAGHVLLLWSLHFQVARAPAGERPVM
eukprot:7379304-Prymnesium_polylepis.1